MVILHDRCASVLHVSLDHGTSDRFTFFGGLMPTTALYGSACATHSLVTE